MSDVLLINPPFGIQNKSIKLPFSTDGSKKKTDVKDVIGRIATPPLGLMYIAAYLKKHDIDVKIIDLRLNALSLASFQQLLAKESPRIVGVYTLTEMYPIALSITKAVKEWDPSIYVVMGGPHVSFIDEEPLNSGAIDVVVRGEGEVSMLEVVRGLLDKGIPSLAGVDGITYADHNGGNGKIRRNKARPVLTDLDSLPYPARELIDLDSYLRSGIMITSRGCPYLCLFCSVNALTEGKYRHRSVNSVISEMFYLNEELKFPFVSIVDDTISAYRNRLTEICDELIKNRFKGEWTCQLRVNEITPEVLRKLKEAGCSNLQFGIESGDDAVLKSIRKGLKVEQIERAIQWTHDAGINIKCSAMIGHHSDTAESIEKTINLLVKFKEHYNARISMGINTPLPGTYLYNQASKLGITIHAKDWSEFIVGRAIIDTKNLSRLDIQKWYSRAVLKTSAVDTRMLFASMGITGNFDEETMSQFMASSTLNQPPYGTHLSAWADG